MNLGSVTFNKFAVRALLDKKITLLLSKAYAYDPEKETVRPLQWTRAEPGDFAWVREPWTFYTNKSGEWCETVYDADAEGIPPAKTKPKHMAVHRVLRRHATDLPLADSRLTIEVLGVRILRAAELAEDDLRKAGIHDKFDMGGRAGYGVIEDPYLFDQTPMGAFKRRWAALRGRNAWNDNMKVAAVSFELHRDNITKFCRVGRSR